MAICQFVKWQKWQLTQIETKETNKSNNDIYLYFISKITNTNCVDMEKMYYNYYPWHMYCKLEAIDRYSIEDVYVDELYVCHYNENGNKFVICRSHICYMSKYKQ